jgi:alkaline phosphatase D
MTMLLLLLGRASGAPAEEVRVTHVAVGEVTATTAVVWGRCERAARLRLRYASENEGTAAHTATEAVAARRDFTARIQLDALAPNTRYHYAVQCDAGADGGGAGDMSGHWRTAPLSDQPLPVRFAWSGDLGGQNVCRDQQSGYVIFEYLAAQQPAFFIALGDMIYADDPCSERGRYGNAQVIGAMRPAVRTEDFWAAWRYNRSDAAFQRFSSATPMIAVWDDHETMNDAGPHRDTYADQPGVHLLPPARQAFLDYQPLIPPAAEPTRLYRTLRWGRHLEIVVLDTRQYRDANEAPDDPQRPKTMLGTAQREWLVSQLTASDATWKIIVSSVPLSIPTCSGPRGCDGWANLGQTTGFERELLAVLRLLHAADVRNMVWLTTDVHFATGFRYVPFAEDPQFSFVEFVAGPLNAGVFPQNELDTTLGTQRLFRHAPDAPAAIASFAELRQWLNFGVIDVDEAGGLILRIVNGNGAVVAEQALQPR